jgi:hypothetical protein
MDKKYREGIALEKRIARRIRELGVYSEIFLPQDFTINDELKTLHSDIKLGENKQQELKAIVDSSIELEKYSLEILDKSDNIVKTISKIYY